MKKKNKFLEQKCSRTKWCSMVKCEKNPVVKVSSEFQLTRSIVTIARKNNESFFLFGFQYSKCQN